MNRAPTASSPSGAVETTPDARTIPSGAAETTPDTLTTSSGAPTTTADGLASRSGAPAGRDRPTVLGVPIDVEGMQAVARALAAAERLVNVATVNPEYVMATRRDPAFRAALAAADVCLADGAGITAALRLRGITAARSTGVELVEWLAASGEPLFLLGAGPGVADAAAGRLRSRFPGARIVGTWAGGSPRPEDDIASLRQIAASGATAVLVAYGAPGQVLWIERNRGGLEAAGVRLAAGVGGALDYHAGVALRPHPLVRRLGLEWFHRLVREPSRWRRQLVLPVFAALATWESITTRWARRGAARRGHV